MGGGGGGGGGFKFSKRKTRHGNCPCHCKNDQSGIWLKTDFHNMASKYSVIKNSLRQIIMSHALST